ncbi:MAG: EAL domain-containing protein [Actinomycetota bacterium]|nr:EAL domain-containing protein [Actinomycetota bacterium]
MLLAALSLTAAAVWLTARRVDQHERDIVRSQTENVRGAVRGISEPVLQTLALAMVLGIDDDGLARFSSEMDPFIARNPLVRTALIVDVRPEGDEVLAAAGAMPTNLDHLDRASMLAGIESFETTMGYIDEAGVIVFASTFRVLGSDTRAVYGELALQTAWLEVLAQDTGRDVHLRYSIESDGEEPLDLYETGGTPTGAHYKESVGLGSSDLVVEAFAIESTIGRAEELAPWFVAMVGLLLTTLVLIVVYAMDRRREEVRRLSIETSRLDSALAERLRIEQELAHRAYHDQLTGLPNRAWLIERMQSENEEPPTAVLFIDLDGFKVVNDSLGHEVGDLLLQTTAQRFSEQLDDGLITRFGGDEFVIMHFGDTDDDSLERVATSIRESVMPALHTEAGEVFVTASIGIRRLDGFDTGPEELLRDADAAMYVAKELGRNRHVVFHASVRSQAIDRLQLDSGMRRALDEGELRVQYQPIFHMPTGHLGGAEALVRWQHPERGLLMPDDFLPMLAETTTLAALDEFVVNESARQLAVWLDHGLNVRVGVNLAASSLDRPDLGDFIAGMVACHGLPPGKLVVELTEKRLVGLKDRRWIQELRDGGVAVGIDDFGTGYSSIAYLRDLPIDFLKVDRSFVEPLGRDDRTGIIVRTLLRLATELGVSTIAEGVETELQAEVLHEFGCGFAQGTWFAPPLDPEDLGRRLAARVTS